MDKNMHILHCGTASTKIICDFSFKLKITTEPSPTKQSDNDNEEEATSLKFDVVGHLPLEIAQKILFQLSPEDLHSATSCCLRWKAALSCDFFWERLCQRERYLEVEEPKRNEFHTNLLKKYNYWQGVYWCNYILKKNWETNNYSEVVYEIENPDNKWLFDDVFVYTSEENTKLNVYCFNSKWVKVYVFPYNYRREGMVSKSGKYFICFNHCTNLTVWDLDNKSSIHLNHYGYNFHHYKNLIMFTTVLGVVKVFNIETEKSEYSFPIEFGQVARMSFMDGRIVFITEDQVVRILKWDDMSLVTLTCCNQLNPENHKLMLKNDILISFCKRRGNLNVYLCVWNITTVTKLHCTRLDSTVDQNSVSFINKCIYFRNYCYQEIELFDIMLCDYMKRTEEVTFKSLHELKSLTPNIGTSNDHIMIVPDSTILKIFSLSKKGFIGYLNFNPLHWTSCNVAISETKLICAILPKESNCIKLFVRDFEI